MSPGPGSAKAVKDETMVDGQEELEEAPQRREDIRVPLGPREPAQKRERGSVPTKVSEVAGIRAR